MVKVLVTGASGLLGRAVLARCKDSGFEVKGLAFSRAGDGLEKLDLTDADATEALVRAFQPDAIIHTAAERRPDVVENDPDASHAINVEVPAHLARLSAELDPSPLLINISTDYVFDGHRPPYKVSDAPNPLNAYGVSKLAGERAVTRHGKPGSSTSVRVPVLYGRTAAGKNDESAVNVLLDAIRPPADPAQPQKKMDACAVRYPTNVEDVARVLVDLVKKYRATSDSEQVPEILHFSATEAMTKYDMSMIFTRLIKISGGLASTDHLDPEYEVDPLAATTRPRHCKLDISLLTELGIDTGCTPFEEWWSTYIEELETLRREEEERRRLEEEARRRKQEAEAAERKRVEEEAAAERKRIEEEAAAERKKIEEEAAAELKRREEEEAAERQRIAEEQAALERQRQEEEETQALRLREQAEAEARRLKEEEEAATAARAGTGTVSPGPENGQPVPMPAGQAENSLSSEPGPDRAPAGDDGDQLPRDHAESMPADSHTPDHSRTVASPDPSLSSLRPLRPTPPATQASRQGSIITDEGGSIASHNPAEASASSSAITAMPGAASDQPPSAMSSSTEARSTASPLPLGEESNVSTDLSRSAQIRQRQQLPLDAPGFFPVSLALNQSDAIGGVPATGHSTFDNSTRDSRLGTASSATIGEVNDADSDGYGQPSPRVTALSATDELDGQGGAVDGSADRNGEEQAQGLDAPAPPRHFQAGYGEVPFPPGQRPRPSGSQDPRPEQDATQTAAAKAIGALPSSAAPAPPKLQFEIRVGDPQKVGDPVTAHIVYTVRTKTTATFFRSQTFSVLRRYSDFRWLHAALVANNPGTFVPPVPEKVKIGRFAPDLVEARRHGLEICINKIAAHPILQMDEDFKLFLESVNFGADVKLRDMRKGPVPTPEQRTYFGWSASLNGPKFNEIDDWFDHQKAYLDSLEAQVKQVVKASSFLATQRRELAHAVSEYSLMLTNLSGSSLSRSMSTCFAGLAELEKRVQELNEAQSDADVRIIGSVMYEYERLVGSIRKAFTTRVDAWAAWYKSDEEARKVQAKHEKFKKDHRGTGGSHMEHRLQLSLQDVADAESRALTLKRDFDAITARCKEEMSRFEREKVEDLRRALVRWLDGLIERQEEIVREWELYAALLTRQTKTNPDPEAPPAAPPAAPAPMPAPSTSVAGGTNTAADASSISEKEGAAASSSPAASREPGPTKTDGDTKPEEQKNDADKTESVDGPVQKGDQVSAEGEAEAPEASNDEEGPSVAADAETLAKGQAPPETAVDPSLPSDAAQVAAQAETPVSPS
ncbi:Vacuolar protein sorting-associated protein vps5 [Tilletia horrida]|uniref:Vacuolar protein sorting-associated protein vps5 n=1 Tax=Tilletia horrida TaxID=155126 RepID=A0AAN6JMM2_9BASI|nr:Vacuolar protein sorting-associated protein vps5 [Tilletia horrida]